MGGSTMRSRGFHLPMHSLPCLLHHGMGTVATSCNVSYSSRIWQSWQITLPYLFVWASICISDFSDQTLWTVYFFCLVASWYLVKQVNCRPSDILCFFNHYIMGIWKPKKWSSSETVYGTLEGLLFSHELLMSWAQWYSTSSYNFKMLTAFSRSLTVLFPCLAMILLYSCH